MPARVVLSPDAAAYLAAQSEGQRTAVESVLRRIAEDPRPDAPFRFPAAPGSEHYPSILDASLRDGGQRYLIAYEVIGTAADTIAVLVIVPEFGGPDTRDGEDQVRQEPHAVRSERTAYAAAGVDVAAGDRAVELLRGRIAGAGAAGVDLLGGLGGFGAALQLPSGYSRPVLVSATDGVGTKTEIARRLGRRDTIGEDLVAMCVDDLVCHGAQPFFFLDYLAVGRLVPEHVADLVGGIATGCAIAGCALVGGETAEHPGLMEPDAFDLAGFAVGIVERERLLDGRAAAPDDRVIGLAASGLHANGYSLVRRLLADEPLDGSFAALVARVTGETAAAALSAADASATLGEVLLRPTRIHAPVVLGVREAIHGLGRGVTGVAHITGGGLPGNLPRAVGPDLGVRVDPAAWSMPAEMRLLAALGGLSDAEVRATFNGGIGMAIVVDPSAAEAAASWLAANDVRFWAIGVVEAIPAGGPRYREASA